MKPHNILKIAAAFCLMGPTAALAQFSSGSTGADGALNVTADTTLDLPPDGIFNYTTITFNGGTLTFNRNALNTPVYLLATGNVVLNAGNNAINVSGNGQRGGPGGFDGGFAAFQGFPPGPGQGPGGGAVGQAGNRGQHGVFGISSDGNNSVYGNTLLSPLIGGSGSGASGAYGAGSGGGGAILLASSTKVTINGNIYANSPNINGQYGSGGAIRVVAPVVDGTGVLQAYGSPNGTHGRVRIDSQDRFAHRAIRLDGIGTRGSQMFVFPPNNPRLDIINAAGTAIAEGTAAPVTVALPVGSPTAQTVRVQARGFTGDVPIRVKITPENGTAATFDAVIPANAGNPPFVDVPVTLVVDTVCHVHAWTR